MNDARAGETASGETLHPSPSPAAATTLTAAAQHAKPLSSHFVDKTPQAVTVARDGVIIQPALHYAS